MQHRHDGEVTGAAQALEVPAGRQLHRQQEGRAARARAETPSGSRDGRGGSQLSCSCTSATQAAALRPAARVQDLQRDIRAGLRIERAPHLALPADAQALAQQVACLERLPVVAVAASLMASSVAAPRAGALADKDMSSSAANRKRYRGINRFLVCHRPAGGSRSSLAAAAAWGCAQSPRRSCAPGGVGRVKQRCV